MSNLDQIFRISPLATTNIIFDVQIDPILLVPSQQPSTSSKPKVPMSSKPIIIFFSAILCTLYNLYHFFQNMSLSSYQHTFWYSTWHNHYNLQSGTIKIIQNIFLSRSLAELSFFTLFLKRNTPTTPKNQITIYSTVLSSPYASHP